MKQVDLPSKRIEFIDALRGIATLYVLLFHVAPMPKNTLEIPKWAYGFVSFGGSGVTLFFLISAFSLCLTWKYSGSIQSTLSDFYLKRFLRIAPLFYVLIIITVIRDWLVYDIGHTASEIFLAASFLFNFVWNLQAGLVQASWTIAVEVMFYVIFPLLILRINNWKAALTAFIWSLVAYYCFKSVMTNIAGVNETLTTAAFGSLAFFRHFPVFLFGMFVYFAAQSKTSQLALQAIAPLILAISAFTLLALAAMNLGQPVFDYYYLQSFAYGGIILGLSAGSNLIMNNRLTRFFGKISYSVYLVHPLVIRVLDPVFQDIYALPYGVGFKYSAAVLLSLLATTVVSMASYRFIELPAMQLAKYLVAKRKSVAARVVYT